MPRNLPRTLNELSAWAQVHLEKWQSGGDPSAIGLSPAQVAQFAAWTNAFEAARAAADAARIASEGATLDLHFATQQLRRGSGALLNVVKAFAAAQGDPGVYPAAGISPPDPQGTLPPPTAPTQFSHRINSDGSLTLRWKARQPRGVVNVQYLISRRLVGETEFKLLDVVGSDKRWTDSTLPAGTVRVEYIVRPRRGDVLGPMSNSVVVYFGVAGVAGVAGVGPSGVVGRMAA